MSDSRGTDSINYSLCTVTGIKKYINEVIVLSDICAHQFIHLSNNDSKLVQYFVDTVISHKSFKNGMDAIFGANCMIEHAWFQPNPKDIPAKEATKELQQQDVIVTVLLELLIPDLINIVLQYSKPVVKISPNMFLDILDGVDKWTIAKVQNLFHFKNDTVLHLSYLSWQSYHDEYILLNSPRIRILYNYKGEVIFNWNPCKISLITDGEELVEYRLRGDNSDFAWKIGPTSSYFDDYAPIGTFIDKMAHI